MGHYPQTGSGRNNTNATAENKVDSFQHSDTIQLGFSHDIGGRSSANGVALLTNNDFVNQQDQIISKLA